MERATILITCSIIEKTEKSLEKFSLAKEYTDAIIKNGGRVLMMPYGIDHADIDYYLSLSDGLLLTGGVDVNPKYYNEEVLFNTVLLSDMRDSAEEYLYKKAKQKGIPIFGICRGMQAINSFEGGSLYQDLPVQKSVIHSFTKHDVEIQKESLMYKLFGEKIRVNSYHHQAVKQVAEGFVATMYDGEIVEAIEHESLPIFALQSHPERQRGERTPEGIQDMDVIFSHFVGLCGDKK